ncbi:hypothetical protein Tco_0180078 [Tanacetum coccineum]
MYQYKLEPVNGSTFWPKCMIPSLLLPPHHHVLIGRPRKKRRMHKDEIFEKVGEEWQDVKEGHYNLLRKEGVPDEVLGSTSQPLGSQAIEVSRSTSQPVGSQATINGGGKKNKRASKRGNEQMNQHQFDGAIKTMLTFS